MTGLSKARILVTNDDGIHAPGLKACIQIAKAISQDVWVVAPESEQSAASHSLTLRRPLRLRKIATRTLHGGWYPDRLRGHGPTRSPERPATGSGSQRRQSGGQPGRGTSPIPGQWPRLWKAHCWACARSRSAKFVRQAAKTISWKAAEHLGPDIVRQLMSVDWPREVLINVNFPALPPHAVKGAQICRQGRRDTQIQVAKGKDPGGRDYYWIGDFLSDTTSQKNTDLAVIEAGTISVTPLHLDLTHKAAIKRLGALFA